MVKVIFLNLLQSKYGIDQLLVLPGTVRQILDQIIKLHPQIHSNDFEEAVLFVNQVKIMHLDRFEQSILDGDEIVLTHFVGGG